jgi:DeoR family transcriptional regulator, suf operon transcriptional repressor
MSTASETSDARLLDLLRQRGAMSIAEVADASEVTATAVRQRLTRLISQGLVERDVARTGRGRPSHRYSLTEKARRQVGSNFADLALVLWEEVRAIADPEIRRGLLQRLAGALARMYEQRVGGTDVASRMESVKAVFEERQIPLQVAVTPAGPMLTIVDCPYAELAEKDRGICAVEKMLFAELLHTPLRLETCRLDGHTCCQFQSN